MEAAVQSLKKGKSAGVDIIPAELVQAGGEDVNIASRQYATISGSQEDGQSCLPSCHHISHERQPAAMPELPNDQPHQPPKQSHAEDPTEQTDATGGEDRR